MNEIRYDEKEVMKKFYYTLFRIEKDPTFMEGINLFDLKHFIDGYNDAVWDNIGYMINFDVGFRHYIDHGSQIGLSVLSWPGNFLTTEDCNVYVEAVSKIYSSGKNPLCPEAVVSRPADTISKASHQNAMRVFFSVLREYLAKTGFDIKDFAESNYIEVSEHLKIADEANSRNEQIEDAFLQALRKIQVGSGLILGYFTLNNLKHYVSGYQTGVIDQLGYIMHFPEEFNSFLCNGLPEEQLKGRTNWIEVLYASDDPYDLFVRSIEGYIIDKGKQYILNEIKEISDFIIR